MARGISCGPTTKPGHYFGLDPDALLPDAEAPVTIAHAWALGHNKATGHTVLMCGTDYQPYMACTVCPSIVALI